jgi:hypothetical protein
VGSESLFVLTYLINATLAQAKTPLALGLMAVFAQFPFLRDARLRPFPFNPACFEEDFAPFFHRPFPHELAVTYISAFTGVGRLRGAVVGVVGFVHFVHPSK